MGKRALTVLAILGPLLLGAGGRDQTLQAGGDPASAPDVALILSRSRARPGETVSLVLSVKTSVPIKSLSIALDFDESKVRVVEARRPALVDQAPVLAPEELSSTSVNNSDEVAGNQLREGWIHFEVDAIADKGTLGLAPDVATPILEIKFQVLGRAALGFTPVEFRTVGPVNAIPSSYFLNRVETVDSVDPEGISDDHLQGGGIEIIGEVGFFMRGDSNVDRRRDISDPIITLSYLFTGGVRLACQDASDANDDGKVDLSDAIFSLDHLFSDPGPFPEPESWGKDPTPDALPDCLGYSNLGG